MLPCMLLLAALAPEQTLPPEPIAQPAHPLPVAGLGWQDDDLPTPLGDVDGVIPWLGQAEIIQTAVAEGQRGGGGTLGPKAADLGGDEQEKSAREAKEPKRRGLPAPFSSLPFPSSEYQGYPNIGVPDTGARYFMMKELQGTFYGDILDSNRIKMYGWLAMGANLSTSKNSNFPMAYDNVPNSAYLNQAIFRFERVADTVQTDHLDWGFRFTNLYGIDYRYTTAKGYFSEQLLEHNRLYGYDPLEIYGELYVPWVADGMVLRLGRYISPPDIEAQLAPDNYLHTHSILYAYDAYTQTGLLATVKLDAQWHIQFAVTGTDDMALWVRGVQPTYMTGVRWVSKDNNDSVYTCLNSINNGKFQGDHDNLQYIVSTWSHRFTSRIHTATEVYYLWQYNALQGGSVNNGPVQSFGGGGGPGALIPGVSRAYGVLNYTMFQLSKLDYITVRNEYWNDPQGQRTGFPTAYTTHTIGWCHHFSEWLQFRPELSYDRSYNTPAFNNGTRSNQFLASADVILRF